ncbi:YfaZ family outer membrane protein [Erwinia persicina]|uniref:Porin n=1 Tax=Erwinia persicina TaxID=55211 RepID=A0A4V5U734_9GAMM|nr:YfaZ family outer membrane protein [Erwinia persicina]MBD8109431.1 porin [Erwinia persicina]MBD8170258.1 porin [Erwinia persicina]MBD8212577.1 porin [Erwinia persicina]TKJ80617.1 porin [Erwinia persicina]
MKKEKIAALVLLCASSSAMALGVTAEQGKNYTNINAEAGKSSGGLYLESNWVKNTRDGVQIGEAGTGYNLELGPVLLSAGVKAAYIGARKGDNGVAFPVGGGVRISLPDNFALYGEGYSAPEYLTNSVKNFVEADGGISWTPMTPLTLKAGYRYAGVDGKDGRPGHTLIDGPFIGGGVTF